MASTGDIAAIRQVDGRLLLVFHELMRGRSATVAAQHLGVSQPAVSHSLARLRRLFSDSLFIRRADGLYPTRRALVLAPQVDAVIELIVGTLSSEKNFEAVRSMRHFKIGAPEHILALFAPALISRMQQAAPGISIEFELVGEAGTPDALREGDVDVAVGRFEAAPKSLLAAPLYEDRYCVVARRAHKTLKGRISKNAYRTIGHVFSGTQATIPASEPLPVPGEVTTLAVVPDWMMVFLIVSATDAIATCPQRLAECHARILDLQIMRLPFVQRPFKISVLWHARRDDGGIDWLLNEIHNLLR